jgi:hypothetical protein
MFIDAVPDAVDTGNGLQSQIHWVMLAKAASVAKDIRGCIDGKGFPKESVHRAAAR